MTVFAHTDRPAAVQPPPLPFQIGTGYVPRFAEIAAPRKWNRLATSFVLHSVAILLLIEIAGLVPAIRIVARNDESTTLILPSLDRPIPAKPVPISPKVLAQLHERPKLPTPTPIVAPKIEMPLPKPEAPKIVAMNNLPPELPKPPAPPKKIVQGVFDSASAAPATQAHAHDVQTGGFGDPNGVAGKSNTERKVTVASAGSFDLPSGNGNDSRGKHAVVASAGFGAETSSGSDERNLRSAVSTGGFGEASTAAVAAKRASASDVTPVEILFKPKPVYTAEARELHIEGEVLLDVMFAASGDVRVLRIVRGLGHGLDEAAENAGQKIRFEPAKKDGRPYDSDAVVHIVFELAE